MPERVDLLEQRLGALESQVDDHDAQLNKLDDALATLRLDVARIGTRLESIPTQGDVARMEGRLTAKVDEAFNNLLQKALDSVPIKQAALSSGVAALVAIIMLVLGLIHWIG